jgi:hypothetical protein
LVAAVVVLLQQAAGIPAAGIAKSPHDILSFRSTGEATQTGEMAEWLKAHAWKACIGETLSRVRIPVSPPIYFQ